MSNKINISRLWLVLLCFITASLWSISNSSNSLAASLNSAAPTTSLYVMQDFETGGNVIQSWWNSTVTTEGPNGANAYEGDYYGQIVIDGVGSTNPIFQDAVWGASHIDISSYDRVCMWVFDESTIAGTHLGLILRNVDETVTTTQLRNTQSTSPGEWRKLCWNLADFDNQSVMTQFFMMTLFPESILEINGNNVDGGPFRIDYVHFEGPATINCAANEVGGRIYLDQNSNTFNEASEVGYSGATVTIYDNTGASDIVTTDANGYYSSTAFSAGADLRVELTVPNGYESAIAGNTSVLFTQAGTCEQDIGIYQTAQYCEENPQMATSCYIAGLRDGDNAGLDAIVSFPYDATGAAHDSTGTTPVHAALVGDVGTTWGMGYQRQTETLYATAFLKRLSDLGPLGTGGIYSLDYSNPSAPVVSNFVNISVTLSIDTGPDPRDGSLHNASLPISGMTPVRDQNAYLNVGKVSMGDMDISDDGNTMWFVNLYDQSLYGITNLDPNTPPVPGDVLGPYDIAAQNPGCNLASDVRPWGLNYTDSIVYVGLVCSAESTGQESDLHAYVLAFDTLTNSFNPTPVADFALTGRTACIYWFTQPDACSWRPWGSDEHIEGTDAQGFNSILNPQPILADIEFDNDGSMVIAFMDRHGHQSGAQNYSGDLNDSNPNYIGMAGGDIVRVCNNNGTFQLEQGGICPNGNTEHGYGGNISGLHNGIYGTAEYYKDDFRDNDPTHAETASGGLALHPSSGEVAYSAMDPIGNINSGGIRWDSNTTGLRNRGYELYQEEIPTPNLGKATGIGDVELLCSLPTLEVGNRVWHDSNVDGIQDPSEPVLPNVVVELLDSSGTVIATATTDANGLYLFSSGLVPANPSPGAVYNVAGLAANTTGYTVRIAKNDTALGGLNMTTSNAEGDTTNSITDLRDSDAISSGNYAVIPFDTAADGANNHTLDFGFATIPEVLIGDRVWIEDDNDGDATTGNITPVSGATVYATASDGSIYTGVTDAAGNYTISVPINAIYTVTVSSPLGTTPAGTLIAADSDPNTQNDLSHDGSGTMITVGTVDNLTIDFGFYQSTTPPACGTDPDDLGGTIWRDYNSNGVQDTNELGFDVVTVTAYDNDGNAVTVPVNPDGTYTFSDIFATETHIRLEFSGLPDWMESGFHGADSGTTVQIHTAATCDADLAVQNPADYCQTNPRLGVACYESGTGDGNNGPGFVSLPYNSDGLPTGYADGSGSAALPRQDADIDDLAAVWGAAYQSEEARLFTASFLKRHVAFNDGPGYVYILDYSNDPTVTLAHTFDLDNVTPASGPVIDLGSLCRQSATDGDPNASCDPLSTGFASDYTLYTNPISASIDLDAFAKVGTISYGDIDLEEDGDTLWLVNLNQRSLIDVDVSNGTTTGLPGTVNHTLLGGLAVTRLDSTSTTFDGLCDAADGVMRPWSLEFKDGVGYVGAICDASLSQNTDDLIAYVFSFDPANPAGGLQEVLNFALDYTRENGQALSVNPGVWRPWASTWAEADPITVDIDNNYMAPQPILSDIEITEDGSMTIALMDRFGHQNGRANYTAISQSGELADTNSIGDIVHACNVNGVLIMEEGNGGSSCPSSDNNHMTGVSDNTLQQNDGPSNAGEYYFEDYYHELYNSGGDQYTHTEITTGGLALLVGSQEVASTVVDPLWGAGMTNSQGIVWYDTTTGARAEMTPNDDHAYMVVDRSDVSAQTFAKANGLGDLELLCLPAPLEIGNYVWMDDDEDGIQDPCEPGIANVDVVLTATDGTTQTVTTDANGEYYFPVDTNSNYTLTIDMTQPELITYTLTTPNVDAGTTLTDGIDSDGIVSGDLAVITLTTGDAGENDHTFDFGFVSTKVALGNLVWIDDGAGSGTANNGIIDGTEAGIDGVTVELYAGAVITGTPLSTTVTSSGGFYLFDQLEADDYVVHIPTSQFASSAWLEGYQSSTGAGADDFNDDNIGENGLDTLDNGGISSAVVNLAPDAEPTAEAGQGAYPGTLDDDNVNMTVDFGFYQPWGSIGDTIWGDMDQDGDGVMDGPDVPLAGVVVELEYSDGSTITTTTTMSGTYLFADLSYGTYTVTVDINTLPLGYITTPSYDPDGGSDSTAIVTLDGTMPDNLAQDFSYPPIPPVMIGDRVWIEDDNDGLATTGVITPVVGSVVTAVGSDGTLYTDTTDAMGYYTITVPANDIYTVTVGTPAGTVVAVPTGGLVTADNDPNTNGDTSHDPAGTVVTVGIVDNLTIDFGFYEPPPAMPSLALSKTLNTPEPVTVGQPISFTIRITNTGNVTITMLPLMDTYNAIYLSYDSINGSTPTTDDNADDGQLDWSDLTITEGDLAPGDVIEVVTRFTANADTSALAAQAPCINGGESCNVATVSGAMAGTDPVPTVTDSDDVGIEVLISGKSTLGDFVWFDTNSDGIKDPSETGINGVLINLYDSTGLVTTTVTMSDTGGIGDDTGTTNGDGFYDFEVLASTVYTVEIDPSNFAPGGALEGYTYTGNNATMPYNGDEARIVGMPAVQHDENNVDFGYVAPILFELSKTLNTPSPARVGERISFTIRITNTGTVVMTTVPLADTYNNAYMSYTAVASPEPDIPNVGELVWNDLTSSGAAGFGMDLNPGEAFEIMVEFITKVDTTNLPNESAINIATSQGITDSAEVQAFSPTSVDFVMSDISYENEQVVLRWQTADESDVVGFHIYREVVGGNGHEGESEPIKLTSEMLFAEKSGSPSGASYTYEDESAEASVDYRYFVGIFNTIGFEMQELLGDVTTRRTVDEWFIFLPITMK